MASTLAIPDALHNEGLKYKKLKTPNVRPSLFKLHTLAAFIGPRGSGKTNAAILLARKYLQDGSLNRVFIMSPTIESNRIFDLLNPAPDDIYKNIHTCLADLDNILGKVKEMVVEYEEVKAYNKIHHKWVMFTKNKGPPLTVKEFTLLENNQFRKRPEIPRPAPLLMIDDMSHSDIYTPSKKNSFINLCLRHRHLFKVGISIFMLVQTFKTGIPKCLRQNIQQFFLWPTHDMSQLDSMYEEFANLCSHEDFIKMFQKCTSERHQFMTIDLNATDPLLSFRKCFDEIIFPPSLVPENEAKELLSQSSDSENRSPSPPPSRKKHKSK
jgi:hypothetical protein